jgi:hypothetical protein
MYSACPNIRAALAFLVVVVCSSRASSSQTVQFARHASDPLAYVHLPLVPSPCTNSAGGRSTILRADVAAASDAPSPCEAPPVAVRAATRCTPTAAARAGCAEPADPIELRLEGMGKAGQKISRAREKVLEILQSDNACRAWFQAKDSDPAGTFQTLSFALDLHGDEFVKESREKGPTSIFRSPYVARVIQGDGPYGIVTLNPKGAFFTTMARVLEVPSKGGPFSFRGTRLLHVGPYDGDTLPAQVVTLLHELGHVLDLLPTDQDNVDGKSVQNTDAVLRSCSAEVDSLARRSAP